MSRHGEVTLAWADGDYAFRLGLSELEELEERFDRSIFVMSERFRSRVATSVEIRETLRIGLIGGGMKPVDALAKVRRYADERPLEENRNTAYLVTLAALVRVNGMPDGTNDPQQGKDAKPRGSTSRKSTPQP